MNAKERGRRRFLKGGAALAGLAVGGLRSASGQTLGSEKPDVLSPSYAAYGDRVRYETTARLGAITGSKTPLQNLMGIITPAGLHMVRTHGNRPPDIDPKEHRLLIHGLVDRALVFTVDELKSFPSVSRIHFITCAGNSYLTLPDRQNPDEQKTVQQTHGKTGCCEWTGVLLSVLLKEAGLKPGAKWMVSEGAEGAKWATSIPLVKAMDDVLVAYGQNGEALRQEHGYPIRLVVPGFEGTRNVKWVRRIQVGDRPFMTNWETGKYVNHKPDGKEYWFQFELEPNSTITFPSGEHRLPRRGFYEITGLAWSGGGAVRRVEVSTDGGRTWKDAQLQEPVLRMAHTRFRFPWNWDGEEAVLMSRCTDERGDVQPSMAKLIEIWGATKDWWLSTKDWIQHINAIQPWKVTREGSVHNAIWEF